MMAEMMEQPGKQPMAQSEQQGPLPSQESMDNYKADAEELELSPEQRKQLDNYMDNMLLLIHKQPAADRWLQELKKTGTPQADVAIVANEINDFLLEGFQKNGKQYNSVTLMYGSYFLVKELIELGEVAGLFQMTEPEKYAAYQLAVQYYMGKGIKNKTIDPVGMQKDLEPLMPEDMRKKGQEIYNESQKPKARTVEVLR